MLKLLFTITALLMPISAFSLAFLCLIKAPRSHIAVLWFLKSFVVGICGLGIFLLVISKSITDAYLSNFILYTGALLIPPIYFHFVSAWRYLESKNMFYIVLAYFLAGVFLVSNYLPPLLIGGVGGKSIFRYWFDPGILYIPFLIYFWTYIIISLYLLYKGYKSSEGIIKIKTAYLFWAAIIGFGGGVTIIFPQLFGIFPFLYFVTFLYPIILAYGIFLKRY